jgi:hypothetical protein
MCGPDEIPWHETAFPSVYLAPHAWLESGNAPLGKAAGKSVERPTRRAPDAIPASGLPVKPAR